MLENPNPFVCLEPDLTVKTRSCISQKSSSKGMYPYHAQLGLGVPDRDIILKYVPGGDAISEGSHSAAVFVLELYVPSAPSMNDIRCKEGYH